MEYLVNITVSLINLFVLFRYCWLLYQKKIAPSLAMWLFFTLAVLMSLLTYWSSGTYTLSDNILNVTDLVLVSGISIAILIYGGKEARFNRFELGCLLAVVLLLVFWLLSKNHFWTHLAVQGILVIAYIPVVRRMLSAKENTEPFSVWIALMLAPIVSMLNSEGVLAYVYASRALVCTALFLSLMLRMEILQKRQKLKESELPAQ